MIILLLFIWQSTLNIKIKNVFSYSFKQNIVDTLPFLSKKIYLYLYFLWQPKYPNKKVIFSDSILRWLILSDQWSWTTLYTENNLSDFFCIKEIFWCLYSINKDQSIKDMYPRDKKYKQGKDNYQQNKPVNQQINLPFEEP